MPKKNEERRGPTQEERRRHASNKPLGGGGTPRPARNYETKDNFQGNRLQRWYVIISVVMLVAMLLSIIPSCFVQTGMAGNEIIPAASAAQEPPVQAAQLSIGSARHLERLAADSPSSASLPAPDKDATNEYYAGETGHFIKEAFLEFWRKMGGANILGLPLTEQYSENGRTVQLFEKALLELNPATTDQNNKVQLGFLGRRLADARGLKFEPAANQANSATRQYFPETSQAVAGAFKTYWEKNNGLVLLGFPIGPETKEGNLTYQYFERGMLELSQDKARIANSGMGLLELWGWPRPTRLAMELNIGEDEIYQGRTLAIRLAPDAEWKPQNLKGTLGDETLRFIETETAYRAFRSFAPQLEPATYPMQISYADPANRLRKIEMPIKVVKYNFPLQNLYLPDDQSELADASNDEYDDKQLAKAYNAFTPQILWEGFWGWPVLGEITTEFGQRRAYGDSTNYSRYHGGLDIAQGLGTPVYAPANGKVTYIGTLLARGKAVALDHGAGVTSYYYHLNSWLVKPGDTIKKGQVIGQVGTTGRSSGPHLHWEVRVNGIITLPQIFQARDLSY